MAQDFNNDDIFKTIFRNVGSFLKVKNVDISDNLYEQYSGVNFNFNEIPNYTFRLEFQEANYKEMMYGIKRINQCEKNHNQFLEKNIKTNFHSHFDQKNEASNTSSFLVCATWSFYKRLVCKGKSNEHEFEGKIRELIDNLKNFFFANELTPWGFWKNDLNKNLLINYKSLSSSTLNVSTATKKNLSCPMFIHLGLGYEINKGIFLIGQETYDPDDKSGWGTPESEFGSRYYGFENYIAKASDLYSREGIMMETQSQWLFDHMHEKKKSPFFRAVKEISSAKNAADFYYNSKFVWDELIAMDYNGKTLNKLSDENERNKVIDYSGKKLRMELLLTKPKYAIFFTGSTKFYMDALVRILGINVNIMKVFDENKAIKIFDWNGITCYLTEHPRTLEDKKKWNVIETLKKLVQK